MSAHREDQSDEDDNGADDPDEVALCGPRIPKDHAETGDRRQEAASVLNTCNDQNRARYGRQDRSLAAGDTGVLFIEHPHETEASGEQDRGVRSPVSRDRHIRIGDEWGREHLAQYQGDRCPQHEPGEDLAEPTDDRSYPARDGRNQPRRRRESRSTTAKRREARRSRIDPDRAECAERCRRERRPASGEPASGVDRR